MEHSKLPWKTSSGQGYVTADNGNVIASAYTGPKMAANAKYIVRACNNYQKLVDQITSIGVHTDDPDTAKQIQTLLDEVAE